MCAAPSACSSRCATCSRRRPVHGGLRRGGDRGALRPSPRPHELPAVAAPDARTFRTAAAAVPVGDGVARPARLRPRAVELERVGARRHPRRARGPRLLLPQPVPLRVERARGDARRPRPARPRRARRDLPALAAVGLDRRPARGRLRRELRDDAPARRALLRPRRDRPAPAGRDRPLRARAGRRRLRRALGAHAAQADRRRDPRVQRLRLPLVVVGNGPDSRRLRRLAGPTIRFTGRVSDAGAALLSAAPARSSSPPPRSSGSPPSRPRPPAAR